MELVQRLKALSNKIGRQVAPIQGEDIADTAIITPSAIHP